MANQASGLRYAVRLYVVFKYFGQMNLILAILTLAPLLVSLISGESLAALRYTIVICCLTGLWIGTARMKPPANMQVNEGLVLVVLMFFFTPLVMAYPMMSSELSFLDAFFEAVSGVTTTGLSTKTTLVDAPTTFLFTRAWMQWYGGLGIVVLSLAFIMQPGLVTKSLAATGTEKDDLVGGTRAHARRVFKVYSILTVVAVFGSLLVGINLFDALLYSFSAVSTGGFAPDTKSLENFNWPVQVWITVVCICAAVPLTFYYRLFSKKHRDNVGLFQLKAILVASLVMSLFVSASMRVNGSMTWSQILHHAPLLAFSAQTTSGFSSISPAELDVTSKLLLTFSMLVGGGVESTAGGFKILRLLIAMNFVHVLLLRTCLPKHAVIEHRIANHQLHDEEIHTALILILLFIAILAFSWLPFVAMGYNPIDSLFEVASALGTVGLSTGITSAALPTLLKWVLCVDMLLGRLEIIAWLVLLYPRTWFGRRIEGL
ncbi:potassium transporter TrkG [Desulfogranum marinum]|uniref:TrkH family potassium uptake protein n=1 Tax=Desulfogranum marinum TaxID=453220 RepID=UPI0029C8DE10|nr:potassium transporter TrkG [Desulfogranum marinum]